MQPGPGAAPEKLPDPGEKPGADPGPEEQTRAAAAGPGPSPLGSKPNDYDCRIATRLNPQIIYRNDLEFCTTKSQLKRESKNQVPRLI